MTDTDVARLALADQIMAALAERPLETRELLERVDTICCPCERCQGAPRTAYPQDLWPVLMQLAGGHLVEGVVVPVAFSLSCSVRWRRLAPPAASLPEF